MTFKKEIEDEIIKIMNRRPVVRIWSNRNPDKFEQLKEAVIDESEGYSSSAVFEDGGFGESQYHSEELKTRIITRMAADPGCVGFTGIETIIATVISQIVMDLIVKILELRRSQS